MQEGPVLVAPVAAVPGDVRAGGGRREARRLAALLDRRRDERLVDELVDLEDKGDGDRVEHELEVGLGAQHDARAGAQHERREQHLGQHHAAVDGGARRRRHARLWQDRGELDVPTVLGLDDLEELAPLGAAEAREPHVHVARLEGVAHHRAQVDEARAQPQRPRRVGRARLREVLAVVDSERGEEVVGHCHLHDARDDVGDHDRPKHHAHLEAPSGAGDPGAVPAVARHRQVEPTEYDRRVDGLRHVDREATLLLAKLRHRIVDELLLSVTLPLVAGLARGVPSLGPGRLTASRPTHRIYRVVIQRQVARRIVHVAHRVVASELAD